jgi:hypothetical protein
MLPFPACAKAARTAPPRRQVARLLRYWFSHSRAPTGAAVDAPARARRSQDGRGTVLQFHDGENPEKSSQFAKKDAAKRYQQQTRAFDNTCQGRAKMRI